MNNPVLDAIVLSALDAASADAGWIVAGDHRDGSVRVAAVAGNTRAVRGDEVRHEASAVHAMRSGHPTSRTVDDHEPSAHGAAGFPGVVRRVLSIPIGDGRGALELVRDPQGEPFTIDDIEVVSLLADVAAAAIDGDAVAVPSAAELGAELARLQRDDPERYFAVATAVSMLLGVS